MKLVYSSEIVFTPLKRMLGMFFPLAISPIDLGHPGAYHCAGYFENTTFDFQAISFEVSSDSFHRLLITVFVLYFVR